jgi:hypothetical protein
MITLFISNLLMLKKILMVFIGYGLLLTTQSAQAFTSMEKKALVIAPPSNVRVYPNGQIICKIQQKKTISIYIWANKTLPTAWSPDMGWFSTDACGGDKLGWIHGSQIKFSLAEDNKDKENATWAYHGILIASPSHIRQKPNGKILCQVKGKNSRIAVDIEKTNGDWYWGWTDKSSINKTCAGYIHNSQFKLVKPNDGLWHSLFK